MVGQEVGARPSSLEQSSADARGSRNIGSYDEASASTARDGLAVALVGARRTGKTALARNACGHSLGALAAGADLYLPTVAVTRHVADICLGGTSLEVELWEAPTWVLATQPEKYFGRGRDAVLFVVDCTSTGSVDDVLSHWLQVARYHRPVGSLCFFAGTKADLASPEDLAAVRARLDSDGLPYVLGSSMEPDFGQKVLSQLSRKRDEQRPEPPLLAALPAFHLPWREETPPSALACEQPPQSPDVEPQALVESALPDSPRALGSTTLTPLPEFPVVDPLPIVPESYSGAPPPPPAVAPLPVVSELAPPGTPPPHSAGDGGTWEILRSVLELQAEGGALDGVGSGAWRGRAGRSRTQRAIWRGKQVAVKEVASELLVERAGSPETLRQRIAKICDLRCERLVMLHGVCLQESSGLLVSEYMPGGDLERYLRSRRPEPHQPWAPPGHDVLRWALSLAEALEYLHDRCGSPLVHGNLRPGCLLLCADRSLKLSLCGMLSPLEHGVKKGDTSLANCLYSAPEVLLGKPYDPEADVFSFALILWFICTGVRPLAHLDNDGGHLPSEDVLQAFAEGKPPRPSLRGLARGPLLPALMREAWDPSPENRPKAADLVLRLRAAANTPGGFGAGAGGAQCCSAQ